MENVEISLPNYVLRQYNEEIEHMKNVVIQVPIYSSRRGAWPILEEDYILDVQRDIDDVVVITADKGGLITLARHLLMLAQDEVPQGVHIHYNDHMLEDGSQEMIIGKI